MSYDVDFLICADFDSIAKAKFDCLKVRVFLGSQAGIQKKGIYKRIRYITDIMGFFKKNFL